MTSFAGVGKKGRFVQSVRIMADPKEREVVVGAVFEQTSTLGLRLREEERAVGAFAGEHEVAVRVGRHENVGGQPRNRVE